MLLQSPPSGRGCCLKAASGLYWQRCGRRATEVHLVGCGLPRTTEVGSNVRRPVLLVGAAGDAFNAPTIVSGAAASATAPPSDSAQQRPPQIAVLAYKERPEIGRAAIENIAAAFQDDPSTTYFCRPEKRVQFYRSVLSCLMDWYPGERQLVCTLPPDAAAFVYVYPRMRPVGSWHKLLRGGLAPLLCVRPGRLLAGMDSGDFFEAQREKFLRAHGPFLYVSVVAVRPGCQGAGLGSSLMAFVCDRADAAGMHCYIEATSLRNRSLYERFGFQMVQAWRANPEMPYTYVLSRPPRPMDSETTHHEGDGQSTAAPATAAAQQSTTATTGDPAGDAGGSAAAAPPPPPPVWHQAAQQQRRQQFVERRRWQQRERRAKVDGTASSMPYMDADEYDLWPLWASGPGGGGAFAAGEPPYGPFDEATGAAAAVAAAEEGGSGEAIRGDSAAAAATPTQPSACMRGEKEQGGALSGLR